MSDLFRDPASSTAHADSAVSVLSRRLILQGMGASALIAASGCTTASSGFDALNLDTTSTGSIRPMRPSISVDAQITSPDVMYAGLTDGAYAIPEVPYQKIKPQFRRQIVVDPTGEAPGTIVVHTKECLLYLVQPGGEAIRYGVGVGKSGFSWSGRANIQYGREWPTWTPPREMIERRPELVKWQNGQPGGLDNPLGARALYIFQNGQDTLYRIHGSPEWWSIGQSVSSGCVRLINQDIIDLYNRASKRNPVVVI